MAYWRLGEVAIKEGNITEGFRLLRRSTECERHSSDLLFKYLKVCLAAGEREEFERGFQTFIENNRYDTPHLVVVGCVLDDQFGPEGALKCFDAALRGNPNHVHAWYNKGVTLHRSGKLDEALACYERTLQLQSDHPFARCYTAVILLREPQRRKEAMWNLRHFLENAPPGPLSDIIKLAFEGSRAGLSLEALLGLAFSVPQSFKHIA
jgi:tetratricopeptide (TPR) repeat protein